MVCGAGTDLVQSPVERERWLADWLATLVVSIAILPPTPSSTGLVLPHNPDALTKQHGQEVTDIQRRISLLPVSYLHPQKKRSGRGGDSSHPPLPHTPPTLSHSATSSSSARLLCPQQRFFTSSETELNARANSKYSTALSNTTNSSHLSCGCPQYV